MFLKVFPNLNDSVILRISVTPLLTFTTGFPVGKNSGNRQTEIQSQSHFLVKKAEKYLISEEKIGYSSFFFFF